jgi:hypothetical protein
MASLRDRIRAAAGAAPMAVPISQMANIDVNTELFTMGNRKAEIVTLGKTTNAAGLSIYTGVRVLNNQGIPTKQPDILIGDFASGTVTEGSEISARARSIELLSIGDDENPGPLSLTGRISINGQQFSAPAYIEAWAAGAATVVVNNPTTFTNLGSSFGGLTLSTGTHFTIPTSAWGTYEISWRVTPTGTNATQFALYLLSGTLAAPDTLTGPTVIARTASGNPAAATGNSQLYGQAVVTLAQAAVHPVVLQLWNTAANDAVLYAVGIPASMVIRRISQSV